MKKQLDLSQWITANSRRVLISEMETSHIKNCLNKIKSGGLPGREDYISVFEKELTRRSLMVPLSGPAKVDDITEAEMLYFLDTVSGYVFVRGTVLLGDGQKFSDKSFQTYMETSIFALPKKTNLSKWVEDFKRSLNNCYSEFARSAVYRAHEKELLPNVFSAEWTGYLWTLLGRKP